MDSPVKSLFIRQSFSLKETIHPNELTSIDSQDYDNCINSILLDKIKNKIGNRCNQHGYVDRDTISLVTRSAGSINTTHFNGDMYFDVIVQANICYPTEGNTITCKVIGTNKIGIFAVNNPVQVIVATAHHDDISIFDGINKEDTIQVEIINFKFKLNSDNIQVIGKFIKKIN
jgi:DNA-directed RNA polymerase subunit E'/Rpb7|tara:strand:+ start:519 stop:1037 length:519 start_codon:yes stop_codon:yes gene_type:complete